MPPFANADVAHLVEQRAPQCFLTEITFPQKDRLRSVIAEAHVVVWTGRENLRSANHSVPRQATPPVFLVELIE